MLLSVRVSPKPVGADGPLPAEKENMTTSSERRATASSRGAVRRKLLLLVPFIPTEDKVAALDGSDEPVVLDVEGAAFRAVFDFIQGMTLIN